MKRLTCFLLSCAIGLTLLGSYAKAQSSGLTVKVNQTAFVHIDSQLRGIASPYSPLKITLLPGTYRVTAEGLAGGGRFEQQVDVEAGSNLVLQAQLVSNPAPAVIRDGNDSSRGLAFGQATERQREADLQRERNEREQQLRLLDPQLDNLERQKVEWENLRSSAERYVQSNCQNQSGNIPGWLAGIKLAGCLAATSNRQRAETQLRRLQVEIDSKQREIRRLER